MKRFKVGRYWLVNVDEHVYCVDARTPANAVFSALRKAEYEAESVDMVEHGMVTYHMVDKPMGISSASFIREMEERFNV